MKTYFEFASRIRIILPRLPVNPVEKRMLELSSLQLGKRKYIRAVRRKVVVPDRRYSWMMFEHPADTEPVDTVVLDVNLAQAMEIDRRVAETFPSTILVCGWEISPHPRQAQDMGNQTGPQQ